MTTTLIILISIASTLIGTLLIAGIVWMLYNNYISSAIHREVIARLDFISPILEHLVVQQEEFLAQNQEVDGNEKTMVLKG